MSSVRFEHYSITVARPTIYYGSNSCFNNLSLSFLFTVRLSRLAPLYLCIRRFTNLSIIIIIIIIIIISLHSKVEQQNVVRIPLVCHWSDT